MLLTIDDLGSKFARNSVFDCHLSPIWQQMAIKNSVSNNFLSTFVDSIKLNILIAAYPVCLWISDFQLNQLCCKDAAFTAFCEHLHKVHSENKTIRVNFHTDFFIVALRSVTNIFCILVVKSANIQNFTESCAWPHDYKRLPHLQAHKLETFAVITSKLFKVCKKLTCKKHCWLLGMPGKLSSIHTPT